MVHVSIGGKQIRIRFSNAFGATVLTISSAHVALAAGRSAIKPGSDRPLTFHGQACVIIPPGAPTYSDPLDFDLGPLSDLAVTIHLAGVPEGVTTHPGARAASYLHAAVLVSGATMKPAVRSGHWRVL